MNSSQRVNTLGADLLSIYKCAQAVMSNVKTEDVLTQTHHSAVSTSMVFSRDIPAVFEGVVQQRVSFFFFYVLFILYIDPVLI